MESENCSHLKVVTDIETKIAELNSERKFRFKKHLQTFRHFYEAHFVFFLGVIMLVSILAVMGAIRFLKIGRDNPSLLVFR